VTGAATARGTNTFKEKIDMESFIGQILLLPFNFAPRGWALCDGQILQISQNTALFSLLGTNFGGNGQTTFALPKLAGPSAGVAYYIALQGIYPSRD
jgi:microcystin-dependent protein